MRNAIVLSNVLLGFFYADKTPYPVFFNKNMREKSSCSFSLLKTSAMSGKKKF
jgi:hypothetical protein